MKILWLALILPFSSYALDCNVDGISDSPQKINCYIHSSMQIQSLDVECQDGNYQIHWADKIYNVDQAYHEEVERGSNPLVFQAVGITLTTTSYQIYSKADVIADGVTYDGLCFNK